MGNAQLKAGVLSLAKKRYAKNVMVEDTERAGRPWALPKHGKGACLPTRTTL